MKLSRERKFFVAICGLAVVALVVDRTLLSEAAADDASAADPASLLVTNSPGTTGPRPSGAGTTRKGGETSSAAAISSLLAEMADRNRRQLEQTPDAFHPGAAWSAPDMSQPGPPASDARVESFAKRKVTSIVAGGRGRAGAMVDGRMVYIGQSLDGFTLVSVDNQSAMFEGRSVQVRLSLTGEPRITTVRATESDASASPRNTAAPRADLSGR